MKKLFTGSLLPLLILLTLTLPAMAATVNPSPASSGYMVLPLTFDRTVTTVSSPVIARIKAPFPCAVVGVTASLETGDYASTDETYKVDVLEAGTTILSAPINMLAADTVYAGTLADTAIADEAVVTVVLDVAGTTPSVSDVTVLLVLKRL
jgi:hypothetical protein